MGSETAITRIDPAVQTAIEQAVQTALAQRQVGGLQSYKQTMEEAKYLAQTGILGTKDPGIVMKLGMLAKDENTSITKIQAKYHVWEQSGQITTQPKAEYMLASFRKAGGKVKWITTDPTRVVAAFKAPHEDPVVISCDDETIKRAKLNGRPIHGTYGEDMKVWYVVRRGVRRTMPECMSGFEPMAFEADIIADSDDFEIPATIPDPERPGVGSNPGGASTQDDAVSFATVSEVKKLISAHKLSWSSSGDGKVSREDLMPAWIWLSALIPFEVTGPDTIPADAMDKAAEVFALGRAEVERRIAEDAEREAEMADAQDAEFEDAQVEEDNPFGGVE